MNWVFFKNSVRRGMQIFLVTTLALTPALAQDCADDFAHLKNASLAATMRDRAKALELPSASDIDNKLMAVHLTNFEPENNHIRAVSKNRGRFGLTIHFTLGEPVIDHERGNWSKHKYAVVLPLKHLKEQMVNLMPQDTFILGDLVIPKDAVIFVPTGTKAPAVSGKILFYDPDSGIKPAIEKFLTESGSIRLRAAGGRPTDAVLYKGVDINMPTSSGANRLQDFFKGLLEDKPYITAGLHDGSVTGRLDKFILEIFYNWLKDGTPPAKFGDDPRLRIWQLRERISSIARLLQKIKPSAEVKDSLNESKHELKRYINLLNAEKKANEYLGKTLLFSTFTEKSALHAEILKEAYDSKRLWTVLEKNAKELSDTPADFRPISPLRMLEIGEDLDMDLFLQRMQKYFPDLDPKDQTANQTVLIHVFRLLGEGRIAGKRAAAEIRGRVPYCQNYFFESEIQKLIEKVNEMQGPVPPQLRDFLRDPEIIRLLKSTEVLKWYEKAHEKEELRKFFLRVEKGI